MAIECCKLVGNLELGIDGCIISVNTSCNTDMITGCGEELLEGPTIETLNITAYASTDIWVGCPSRAGVSIPFIRKYDCDNNELHFIFNGRGQSFYVGDVSDYVSLYSELDVACTAIAASSTGGPSAIYTETQQVNGYGMHYSGTPIEFDTDPDGTEIFIGGIFNETFYLQNFSLDMQPGQLSVATYSFIRQIVT